MSRMPQSHIFVLEEVSHGPYQSGERLCLQWVRYAHADGGMEYGFRFIWRDTTNKLKAHRGQARIPTLKIAQALIEEAKALGWGTRNGDQVTKEESR